MEERKSAEEDADDGAADAEAEAALLRRRMEAERRGAEKAATEATPSRAKQDDRVVRFMASYCCGACELFVRMWWDVGSR